MATGGEEKVCYRLVNAGTLPLKDTDESPVYISIIVCQDKVIVIDDNAWKVWIHRLRDGKFLATLDKLESRPRDMCLMDAMTICVLHFNGMIQMMSIDSTDMSPILATTRTLHLQGVLDEYHGVVRFNNNLLVSGVKEDTMYWCIVSLDDGHVDTIHQICKGDNDSYVTTKDNIIYIACEAGYKSPDNTGVYGFDILNPGQCKYTYQHQDLQWPTSIATNEDGNIFVCNYRIPKSCIHQLTASCHLVSIFTQGIPRNLEAIFWGQGRLYVTCIGSSDITVFHPVYQEDGGWISWLMHYLRQKLAKIQSQGEQTVPEIPVSDERKQPVTEKTSTVKEQGVNMASFLFGLLCLCMLSVEGIKVVENEELLSELFSWIAGQNGHNDTIELQDLMTAYRKFDLNTDGVLSESEVRDSLRQMNLPPSSYAEKIFGDVNIDDNTLKDLLYEMGASDKIWVDKSEFENFYNQMVDKLDSIQTNK